MSRFDENPSSGWLLDPDACLRALIGGRAEFLSLLAEKPVEHESLLTLLQREVHLCESENQRRTSYRGRESPVR